MEKKRIYKINKTKRLDPDECLKDFHKTRGKYDKNSVYYNLMLRMKKNYKTSQNANCDNDDAVSVVGSELSDYNSDNEIEINDANDINEVIDSIEDIDIATLVDDDIVEGDIDIDIDLRDEGLEDQKNNLEYPEYNDENEVLSEIDDIDDICIDETIKKVDKINDMSFYKALLSQQGFVFNESSKCILSYQYYIK